jgi:solute carrier family 35, member E1
MASESSLDSSSSSTATFKFPPFQPDLLPTHEEEPFGLTSRTPSPSRAPQLNGNAHTSDRWQPRKEQRYAHANGAAHGATRHARQKSLSEAFRTIRTRKASVSQNAQEIADALKAPVSPKLIVCRRLHCTGPSAHGFRRSAAFGT